MALTSARDRHGGALRSSKVAALSPRMVAQVSPCTRCGTGRVAAVAGTTEFDEIV